MKFKKPLSVFFSIMAAFFLSSCLLERNIHLYQDGSVKMEGSFEDSALVAGFYKSDLIHDISFKLNTTFTMDDIDSLGNYLSPYFHKNSIRFNFHHDTLHIFEAAFPVTTPVFPDACDFVMRISADKKVKSIKTENRYIKQKKDYISIYKKRKYFRKESKKLDVVIVFE